MIDTTLWLLSLGAEGVCLGLLAWRGLAGRYPVLALWMAARLARSGLLLLTPGPRSNAYFLAYVYTEPFLLLLLAGVAVEAYGHLGRQHEASGAFRLRLLAVLGIAALLLAAWAMAIWTDGAHQEALRRLLVARRWVVSTLAALLVGVLAFFRGFPGPGSRNAWRYAGWVAAYLGVQAVSMAALHGLGQAHGVAINRATAAASLVCFVGWWGLTRAGESVPVASGNGARARAVAWLDGLRRFRA